MTNSTDEEVKINRKTLINVIRNLSTIVCSLDRIGSLVGEKDYNIDELTIKFLYDWQVFKRLSESRALLSEPFSNELGEDDMDELERACEDVPIWSLSSQKPPE
jgi:hypothetical protein